jgi:hypothetical protein
MALMQLSALLGVGEFAHGDILTTAMLLDAAGRGGNGWMRRTDGKVIDFDLLTDIDAAWAENSHGRHGFEQQLARHDKQPDRTPAGGYADFQMLAAALGWKQARTDTMPRFGEFVDRSKASSGFFPTLRNPQLEARQSWPDRWLETVMAVHLQLRAWRVAR